jgi:hypothetical protein
LTGYGTQFLQWVVSTSLDQSEYIFKALIRTAFVALSRNPNFGIDNVRSLSAAPASGTILAMLEYDPFDVVSSARVNHRLRDFGYCLALEGFTFDRAQRSYQAYCQSPRIDAIEMPVYKAYVLQQQEPPPVVKGIAYRPRAQYALAIFRKPNPYGRGSWNLNEVRPVKLENISPVVSVGISRSMFAARRIVLMFDDGVLTNMCLAKTAELQSAVRIPYEIVRSIVALPGQAIAIEIDEINSTIALVDIETEILKTQQARIKALAGDNARRAANLPAADKSAVPLDTTGVLSSSYSVGGLLTASAVTGKNAVLERICKGAPGIVAGPIEAATTP